MSSSKDVHDLLIGLAGAIKEPDSDCSLYKVSDEEYYENNKHLIDTNVNAASDIPLRYQQERYSFEDGIGKELIDWACNKEQNGVFFIGGTVGSKKTTMATEAQYQRAYHGLDCGLYLTSQLVPVKVRSSRSFSAKMNEEELVRKYSTCKFLVWDELGDAPDFEIEWEFFRLVMMGRYDNKLPTALLGNLTIEKFKEFVINKNNAGQKIYDRIKHNCIVRQINDKSWR